MDLGENNTVMGHGLKNEPAQTSSNLMTLNSFSVVRILGAVAFFLVLTSIFWQGMASLTGRPSIAGLVPLFDIEREGNIPTFFSTSLLLFAASLLFAIAFFEKNRSSFQSSYWAILAFVFLYMAVDEASAMHELLIMPVRILLGNANLGIFLSVAWVVPGIAITLLVALFFLRFFLRLPAKTRFVFGMAASLYIGGCIGFEIIGGRYAELHGSHNWTHIMIVTIEESLEMAGAILFIHGLLKYISDNYTEVRLRFEA